MSTSICDLCATSFAPTVSNPGTTYLGGYTNPDGSDAERVELLHLCDSCLSDFQARPLDEQHALVEQLRASA